VAGNASDATPLSGVRVLDRSSGIAGPYCTKLLADAGADVVKIEQGGGDPMRSWRSGALFEYLHASKRASTGDDGAFVAGADVLVADGRTDLDALWRVNPELVVVTISPFGLDGPWADRPATEFTLQAACGSTGSRGLPEAPPIAAGGRLGEWITGTYAAVATAAALHAGRREHIDVAMLDCMAVTMVTFQSIYAEFLGWPPMHGTGRMIEVPSIEPTEDGWIVVTTNSATQFHDFLVQIGRPELIDDKELANVARRFARRDEFLAAVHAYTTKRSSVEVLADAADFRIPAGPVLNGATVPSFEQFVARDVFTRSPSGRFRQPRPPYRIAGAPTRPFGPAPQLGEHTESVAWSQPRDRARPRQPRTRPLEGVRVLDLTAWWAGPAAAHVLASLGADVIKVESTARPDLMRFSSTKPPSDETWFEWSPLFHGANGNKRGVTIDLSAPAGIELFERLLTTADVLVENFTPRVMEQFGLDWERVHAVNPNVVMVRMPAFGLDGPWRDRTGFAQTMECITGMAWLTGNASGQPVLVRGACDPLAGLHAVFATILAVGVRDRAGEGTLVESVMVDAALNAAVEQVITYDVDGEVLTRDGNRSALAAPQGLYQCAGEDRWVAIAVADDMQWRALRGVLDDPDWARAAALDHADGRRARHDAIDDELGAWCAAHDADDVVARLAGAGVPAEVVIAARDIAHNPQLRHRGLFEVEHHPVSGPHEVPTMPFRFASIATWCTRAAPTLGQHNDEVLGEIATADELASLREQGIIGERLRTR
jgi:crotonobetainyl-CoA:carnitine CoA-transferase CaiB-like acyl-CoA transferase